MSSSNEYCDQSEDVWCMQGHFVLGEELVYFRLTASMSRKALCALEIC